MGGGSSAFREQSFSSAFPAMNRDITCTEEWVLNAEASWSHLSPGRDLVSSIVMHSFPAFTSYSPSHLDSEELNTLQQLKSEQSSVPNLLEFDHFFFPALSKLCPGMFFSHRPFSLKKKLIADLINLICSNKESFNDDVDCFVEEHRLDCRYIQDYGSIGEVLVSSMYALRSSAVEKHLWAKAYSRFLRSLLVHCEDFNHDQSVPTDDSPRTG